LLSLAAAVEVAITFPVIRVEVLELAVTKLPLVFPLHLVVL
jgi:hypothetical protein